MAILGGTSNSSFILSSNNVTSWSNLGSAGKGNPIQFTQIIKDGVNSHFHIGDIIYITDQGWLVNYTNGYALLVSTYPLQAITPIDPLYQDLTIESEDLAIIGDSNNHLFLLNNDETIYSMGYVGSAGTNTKINGIIAKENIIVFKDNGMYNYNEFTFTLIMSGYFSCCYYDNNGIAYTATNDSHIWKSIDAGLTWTDLGKKGTSIITNIVKYDNQFIFIG